jgi:YHS domain-containing protein
MMLPRRLIDCCFLLLVTTSVLVCLPYARAQQSAARPEAVIPLEGLDPVMLSQGKEVQGDMKYKATRGQFQYIFASEENKATFEKDPSKYEIQLDGYCARMGAPTSGNPDLFAVHDGRIYIFGSAECQTLFKATPAKYLEVSAPLKSPPSAEMVKRGQDLIAKTVEALGGASKLDGLTTLQRKDVRGNNIKNTLMVSFPDLVRQEVVRPNFTLISVVGPAESFFLYNNSTRPMAEIERVSVYKELNHDLIAMFRARSKSEFKAWASDNEHLDVELSGFTASLEIDPKTARVLSQSYRGRGPGGAVGEIKINYSDYRTVDGLSLPFKLDATFDGQPYPALSSTIETQSINAQLDPASFKKPAPKQ